MLERSPTFNFDTDNAVATDIPPRLDPKSFEPERYRYWVEGGCFEADPRRVIDEGADPFVICLPPPNVTAVLHMGHGLNATVQDVLMRWMRMRGREALWVPGTDHAGIATHNVVERRLARRGITRKELGRERFEEEVWRFVRATGPRILEQLRAIGASCDWNRTRFTLDDELSKAVRRVFLHLHAKGLVYRGEYLINWCPRCHTALSNEEAEGREVGGRLWHLRYPIAEEWRGAAEEARRAGASAVSSLPDGGWHLTVSTTRPETMLGDTGVAVHPNDRRHRSLVGAEVELPLTGRRIPVVADDHVDPAFGSGMVKLTPAHDSHDFEIAARTGLEAITVLTEDGRVGAAAPARFHGMTGSEAREAVIDALKELGLVAGDEPHAHAVPHCYRCDTLVEPRVSPQWFVRMKPLAEPALLAYREGRVTFTPEHWGRVYEHWLENIRDWCISRQLWWGHRIPVWYCECGEEIVAPEDPRSCQACGSSELAQDPDVLDTWFSSQLWPFSVMGWPERTADLEAFYPGHSMVTAPEILFLWVARMIMMGLEFEGEVPFREVYLHGTVRDAKGRKMSKSLGNGIDPLEVVESHGADAMRYTLIAQCAVGTDINLDHTDVDAAFAAGRNFANKIWNAGRFALGALGTDPILGAHEVSEHLKMEDRWILSRTGEAARSATQALGKYRLHEAAETLYHFFWGELCDWYLELIKERLAAREGTDREAARTTLARVLDRALGLLHPLMPFVTAEIWSRLPLPGGSRTDRAPDLAVSEWPDGARLPTDREAEARVATLVKAISFVRRMRRDYRVPARDPLELHVWDGEGWLGELLGGEPERIWRLARVREVRVHGRSGAGEGPGVAGEDGAAKDGAGEVSAGRDGAGEDGAGEGDGVAVEDLGAGAHAFVDGFDLFVPLEGVIDVGAERSRLAALVEKTGQRLARSAAKLANQRFVERAPAEVVERERARSAELEAELVNLREKRDRLGAAG